MHWRRIGLRVVQPGRPGDRVSSSPRAGHDAEALREAVSISSASIHAASPSPAPRCVVLKLRPRTTTGCARPTVDFTRPEGASRHREEKRRVRPACVDKMGKELLDNIGTRHRGKRSRRDPRRLGDEKLNHLGTRTGPGSEAYRRAYPEQGSSDDPRRRQSTPTRTRSRRGSSPPRFQQEFDNLRREAPKARDCPLGTSAQAVDVYKSLVEPW